MDNATGDFNISTTWSSKLVNDKEEVIYKKLSDNLGLNIKNALTIVGQNDNRLKMVRTNFTPSDQFNYTDTTGAFSIKPLFSLLTGGNTFTGTQTFENNLTIKDNVNIQNGLDLVGNINATGKSGENLQFNLTSDNNQDNIINFIEKSGNGWKIVNDKTSNKLKIVDTTNKNNGLNINYDKNECEFGIGVSVPEEALDISGNIKFSGDKIKATKVLENQFLMSKKGGSEMNFEIGRAHV